MTTSTQRLLQCAVCSFNQAGDLNDPPTCPQHPERYLVAQKHLLSGPKDFLLGTSLSQKYILLHTLGQGQYGKVYRALQIGAGGIKKPVAIKILREDRAEAQALFLDEMKVISQLNNAHIVRYLDSGFDPNSSLTYMVMELVDGETLTQLIDSSITISLERALDLTAQLLIALDEAHGHRIVHRDLKPSNVMLSSVEGKEVLKVLDFGVARPDANQQREQTQGVIPGTPAYMAPELFSRYDGQVHASMDLFSVGVIFYQCLAGHLPFDVEGKIDHLIGYYKLYSASPKPLPLPSSIPNGLQDVIMRALALDPKRRYHSARDMLKALAKWSPTAQHYLTQRQNVSVGAPRMLDKGPQAQGMTSGRLKWFIVAAALGGVLGLGAHFLYGKSSKRVVRDLLSEPEPPKIEQREGQELKAPTHRGQQAVEVKVK